MVGRPDIAYPELTELQSRMAEATIESRNHYVDAGEICARLFGGTASANIFLIGVAIQAGALPVSVGNVQEAIRLNGVAVDTNLAAFAAGRHWIKDPAVYAAPQNSGPEMIVPEISAKLGRRVEPFGAVVEMLTADLVGFQNEKYARRFLSLVERTTASDSAELTEAVARGFHKLMAYKDEYEVARLLIGAEGEAMAQSVGGVDPTVSWRLHPPMLKALGMDSKIELPTKVGRPAMKALARGKHLRGTASTLSDEPRFGLWSGR